MEEIAQHGYDSPRGRQPLRMVNRMHGRHDSSNDDMLSVLSTFVFEPVRWSDTYGWRALSDHERRAGSLHHLEVGRRMGIRGIPPYGEFERFNRDHEARHYRFAESNRAVAEDNNTRMMGEWFPRPLRPSVRRGFVAGLEPPMRRAFGFPEPRAATVALVRAALRAHGVAERCLPARRVSRLGRGKNLTYPGGCALSTLGATGGDSTAGTGRTSREATMTERVTPPEESPGEAHDAEGLFGPGSITWHLHGDPAMWIAGIASLYVQALHPRAVAAIVQNSRFEEDPLGRLLRTSDYVATVTYGTAAQARSAARRVRGVHRALRGTDPRTGEVIRLDDPDLLRWIHCAEVSTFAAVVGRAGFPLTGTQVDRYFAEQTRAAALVGLDPASVPASRREMAAYFARTRPGLACTTDSETVYRFLHRPLAARWTVPVDLGYAPVGHLAYSAQPPWARALYGRRAFAPVLVTTALGGFRAAGRVLPAGVRWRYPSDHVERAVARLGPRAYPSATTATRL